MESVVSGTNRDGEKCEHNFFSCMRRKVNLEPVILICTVRYRHVGHGRMTSNQFGGAPNFCPKNLSLQ